MAKMETTPEQATTQQVDLTSVLEQLKEQKALIAELQAKQNPENAFKKAKEKYVGPRNYSYKLWGGIPVLSYKSVKKDVTKDFTYKNHLGVLTNNHDLELTLANEKTIKVDIHEFNNNFERSEKLPAEPVTDGVTITGYRFTDTEIGEFIVATSLIN